MTTLPFSVSRVNKLRARSQALRWSVELLNVRQFRAYCCDINSDGIMGVAKEPVVIADISPNPLCEGYDISWDISSSYAPGSTLTAWEISFGDSSSSSGADFPNDTTSGTHTYAAAGTYDVVITIQEGGGRSQTSTVEVTVVICGEYPYQWSYAGSDGAGVWFIDWTEATPNWVQKNEGLSGNDLFVRSLVLVPSTKHLSPTKHKLWAATLGGIFKTEDGGNSWTRVSMPDPSNDEFSDSPAATADELDWHHIVLDPDNENTVYVLASKVAT